MYHRGIGVAQDYHLAKRYYDLAAELKPDEARIPVAGSLFLIESESAFADASVTSKEGTVTEVGVRSEEHKYELRSLMRISYGVLCLKKKRKQRKMPLKK